MRFSSRANGVAERPQACTPVMPLRFSSRANGVAARPQPLLGCNSAASTQIQPNGCGGSYAGAAASSKARGPSRRATLHLSMYDEAMRHQLYCLYKPPGKWSEAPYTVVLFVQTSRQVVGGAVGDAGDARVFR